MAIIEKVNVPDTYKKGYNGWKNYNQWNVALWINNDESLYFFALGLINECGNKDDAADLMVYRLKEEGITHTPDGVPYNKTNIRAAMVGMPH